MEASLCETCLHVRVVRTDTGSRFLLCGRARTDARYVKYPPQPLLRCAGHEPDAAQSPDGRTRST